MKLKFDERTYRFTLLTPLLGTIPKNRELFTKYVLSRYPDPEDTEDSDLQSEVEMQKDQELATAPDGTGETGFHTDHDGVYGLDYHLVGYFKEVGNTLKDIPQIGIRALKRKVERYLFIQPRYIWLAEKPDGHLERPLRAWTPKGEKICLVKSDYVKKGRSFEIKIILLPNKEVTWDIVELLMDYGEFRGLGQWRNAGFGRFTWERLS